ncbi:MAG: hypothetical protein AAF125_07720 [Chloroflexota bacterium]
MEREKNVTQQAAIFLLVGATLVVLLVLDLVNRGLVWRALRALRSENTASLPGEDRTVGDTHRTDVTFLS